MCNHAYIVVLFGHMADAQRQTSSRHAQRTQCIKPVTAFYAKVQGNTSYHVVLSLHTPPLPRPPHTQTSCCPPPCFTPTSVNYVLHLTPATAVTCSPPATKHSLQHVCWVRLASRRLHPRLCSCCVRCGWSAHSGWPGMDLMPLACFGASMLPYSSWLHLTGGPGRTLHAQR